MHTSSINGMPLLHTNRHFVSKRLIFIDFHVKVTVTKMKDSNVDQGLLKDELIAYISSQKLMKARIGGYTRSCESTMMPASLRSTLTFESHVREFPPPDINNESNG